MAAGQPVRNGELLAELDGAPLFALTGPVPAWRDLTAGESGPDITELQRALAGLGYDDDGDTPGYFGPATQDAVDLYYEHLGYAPPVTGGVPESDVVFLPKLPATVVAVNGAAGQAPGQPLPVPASCRSASARTRWPSPSPGAPGDTWVPCRRSSPDSGSSQARR